MIGCYLGPHVLFYEFFINSAKRGIFWWPFICMSVYLYAYLYDSVVYMYVLLCLTVSICLSIHPSVYSLDAAGLLVCLSVCVYIAMSNYLILLISPACLSFSSMCQCPCMVTM